MISAMRFFSLMNGGKIKPDSRGSAMKNFGKVRGFKPTTKKQLDAIFLVQINMSKKYEGGGLQVGCNFILYFKSMHTIKRPVENPNKLAKKRVISSPDWLRETCIFTQPNFG